MLLSVAVATVLKHIRIERNIKQREMAKKLNLSSSMLAQLEHGNRKLSVDTCGAYACALNVPITIVFEYAYAIARSKDKVTRNQVIVSLLEECVF